MHNATYSNLKPALDASQIGTLLYRQAILDADIRHAHDISKEAWTHDMYEEHLLALRVEVAEFINEAHSVWKYWKKKPVDRHKIISEAVDVIHFVMLILNKTAVAAGDKNPDIRIRQMDNMMIDPDGTPKDDASVRQILLQLSLDAPATETPIGLRNYTYRTLVRLTQVLDAFDFDTDTVMDAYDEKNKENFRRIEENY